MSEEKEMGLSESDAVESVVNSDANKQELISRLDVWVKERPMRKQRQVRRNISTAITTDILDPVGSENVPRDVVVYRGHVNMALERAIGRLMDKPVRSEDGVVVFSTRQVDEPTGVSFITRIRRTDDAWISEEINDQSEVISQAVIKDDGTIEITLNYTQLSDEANPSLKSDADYPTGTKVLFVNHCASLGVISWSGK